MLTTNDMSPLVTRFVLYRCHMYVLVDKKQLNKTNKKTAKSTKSCKSKRLMILRK